MKRGYEKSSSAGLICKVWTTEIAGEREEGLAGIIGIFSGNSILNKDVIQLECLNRFWILITTLERGNVWEQ